MEQIVLGALIILPCVAFMLLKGRIRPPDTIEMRPTITSATAGQLGRSAGALWQKASRQGESSTGTAEADVLDGEDRVPVGLQDSGRRREARPLWPSAAGFGRRSRIALGVVLAAVGGFLLLRGGNPVGIRVDSWSDANVLVSGRNYARLGITSNYGAAQHQVTNESNPNDPFFVYTKYPVGPNLINGLWQIAGVSSVRVQRLLPAACSIAAVLAWLRIYACFVRPDLAGLAAIMMATSYGFLAYADNLHFHAYALLTSAATILCFVRAMQGDEGGRRRRLILSAAWMFVTALLTWEYYLYIAIFIALYALLLPCPVRRRCLPLLLVPLFLALALQVLQRNALTAGLAGLSAPSAGPSGILRDIYRRTIGFQMAGDTPEGLTVWNYPLHVATSFFMFYGIPAAAFVAMMILVTRFVRRDDPDGGIRRFLLILLAAGAGWWLVMIQHTSVHPHVMRHALPAYSLIVALVMLYAWRTLMPRRPPGSAEGRTPIALRATAALLLAAILYAHLDGAVLNVRLHLGEPLVDSRRRSDGGPWEAGLFSELAECVPAGAVILTNLNRLPLMRYWTQRPVYWALRVRLPIDDPEHGRWTIDLVFNHLRELYHDRLPPLYFVYYIQHQTIEQAFAEDPQLRFMATGSTRGGADAWRSARPLIEGAITNGGSEGTFCSIVCANDDILCFDLAPAVPSLYRDFGKNGYPSLAEFGEPR